MEGTIMSIHDNAYIEKQIHELEDLWSNGYFYETLHEFLGLSWDQFQIFTKTEELPDNYWPPQFYGTEGTL